MPSNNKRYIFVCDYKSGSYLLKGKSIGPKASHFVNIFKSDFVISVAFSVLISALIYAVLIIVSLGSQKQMGRINASPNVATVKNAHAFWDWAKMDHPRKPVSIVSRAASTDSYVPISSGCVYITLPNPTIIGFFHSGEKLFLQSFLAVSLFGIPSGTSAIWTYSGNEIDGEPIMAASLTMSRMNSRFSHNKFIASVERETFGGTPPAMKNCFCRSTGNVPIVYQNIAVMSI